MEAASKAQSNRQGGGRAGQARCLPPAATAKSAAEIHSTMLPVLIMICSHDATCHHPPPPPPQSAPLACREAERSRDPRGRNRPWSNCHACFNRYSLLLQKPGLFGSPTPSPVPTPLTADTLKKNLPRRVVKG